MPNGYERVLPPPQQIQLEPWAYNLLRCGNMGPFIHPMSCSMHAWQDDNGAGMQMEDNGIDFPRPGRAPVRGQRPLRAPGNPDADAMALHGLGLVPMDMSEEEDSEEEDSDEDDNHEEVSPHSLCAEARHAGPNLHQDTKRHAITYTHFMLDKPVPSQRSLMLVAGSQLPLRAPPGSAVNFCACRTTPSGTAATGRGSACPCTSSCA